MPEDWADTLSSMENEGLMLSEEEFATVLKYLARTGKIGARRVNSLFFELQK